MKRIVIFTCAIAALFLSCGSPKASEKDSDVVSKYLSAVKSKDYAAAYALASESDRGAKTASEYTEEMESEYGLLFTDIMRSSMEFNILEKNESAETASVKVEIKEKDYSSAGADLFKELLGQAFSGANSEELAKSASAKMEGMDAPIKTRTVEYNLVKEGGEWKISFGWEKALKIKALLEEAKRLENDRHFKDALDKYREAYGLDSSDENLRQTIDSLADKVALIEDKLAYMKNVSVYDFKAKYYKISLWGNMVPGVTFKIKNSGDRELSGVEVTVYFKDASGATIHEETYWPVNKGGFDTTRNKTLKPNYVWQMEPDHFYAADSCPSEWQEGAAEIAVTGIEFN